MVDKNNVLCLVFRGCPETGSLDTAGRSADWPRFSPNRVRSTVSPLAMDG